MSLFSRRTFATFSVTIFVGFIILAIWHFSYHFQLASRLILPSPAGVFRMTFHQLASGLWWPHIGVTLAEALIGFSLGVIAAILLGALFAYIDWLRQALFPYILAAQTFPKIAIAPLLVAWLGYGLEPKILIAAILAFFPVFLNTIAGLKEVDKDSLYLMRSLNATAFQEFWYLRFPNALSYIFPAFTISAVMALLGAIVGEFVGATAGLGFLIQQYSFQGDLDSVYGILIVLSCIGLSIYGSIKYIEHRVRFTR